jgi:hypothetical protein
MGATQQVLASYGASFVGPLDALVAQGATLLYAGSVRRLLSSYGGSLLRLRGNGTGSPEADISPLTDGDLDLTAAAAIAAQSGGTAAFFRTWHDQTGHLDAVQTTEANQMQFSTVLQAKGAAGAGAQASNVFLNLNLGTLPTPCYFLFAATMGLDRGNSASLFGVASSTANRRCQVLTGGTLIQNWGTSLSTLAMVPLGPCQLGFLNNGAGTSHNLINGSVEATGSTGGTQLDCSGGRIGSTSSFGTNWLSWQDNSLSEVIIFSSDPTGLVGWSSFLSNQRAYFGAP